MFFAACTTFQSDTRANVSEEPEGLLCFLQLVGHFRVIPERMSLKSQRACYVFRSLCDFSEDTRANVSEEPRGFNMLVLSSTF